jgi:hypothetical protein
MWLASRVFGTVVFVWVVIGTLAAWERAYFQKLPTRLCPRSHHRWRHIGRTAELPWPKSASG